MKKSDTPFLPQELEAMELAQQFGLEVRIDIATCPLVLEKNRLLPYSFVKSKLVLPIEEEGETLVVAICASLHLDVLEEIKCLTGKKIREVFCPKSHLEEAIEICYHQSEGEAGEYIEGLKSSGEQSLGKEEEYDLLSHQSDSPVIRMLNVILVEAIQQGASDIHFEPLENGMVVRYRIDGVLQFRHSPPREYQSQLITRIKVIAKLDIAEQRLPQDGRIKLNMAGRQIDFRVSTVPIVNGERIVLRILDKGNVLLGLDKLNMSSDVLDSFKRHIGQAQGIVLVTGPTGSGKTTTLYSAISEINSSEMNIMTIEDPVEYKLQGIAQIGVNPKINLTFAAGLRHILRQDPDIIMIGEIRDQETAEIAIQAALTGHLVLTTLHTNDAPSALTRLVDMGIEPYLLTSTVLAAIAQRLVRTICSSCKMSYTPSNQELHDLSLERRDLQGGVLFKGKGCALCYGSGYRGRTGIYELMSISGDIKKQLLHSADSSELINLALDNKMNSLRSSGAQLAIEGVTTSSEILRVTRKVEV